MRDVWELFLFWFFIMLLKPIADVALCFLWLGRTLIRFCNRVSWSVLDGPFICPSAIDWVTEVDSLEAADD